MQLVSTSTPKIPNFCNMVQLFLSLSLSLVNWHDPNSFLFLRCFCLKASIPCHVSFPQKKLWRFSLNLNTVVICVVFFLLFISFLVPFSLHMEKLLKVLFLGWYNWVISVSVNNFALCSISFGRGMKSCLLMEWMSEGNQHLKHHLCYKAQMKLLSLLRLWLWIIHIYGVLLC